MKTLTALMAIAALGISGCQSLDPSAADSFSRMTLGPNTGDGVGEVIAVTAKQRIVIVMVKPKDGERGRYCAEPPPEVSPELPERIKAMVDAGARPVQEPPGKTTAESQKAYREIAQRLVRRTQGVQWFRDGLHSLCQLYVNDAIKEADVKRAFDELVRTSSELIKIELK